MSPTDTKYVQRIDQTLHPKRNCGNCHNSDFTLLETAQYCHVNETVVHGYRKYVQESQRRVQHETGHGGIGMKLVTSPKGCLWMLCKGFQSSTVTFKLDSKEKGLRVISSRLVLATEYGVQSF